MKGRLFINLAMIVAYFSLGKLGLILALPPGYVTAFWPSAGIAIAGCLLWRNSYIWLGIFLGSYLTNTSFETGFQFDWLSAAIAMGSTIQAIVGANLIRRIDRKFKLDSPTVVLWSGIAIAVSCFIATSIGNSALVLKDLLLVSELGESFLTWWVGDLFGAVIFVPLTLLIFDPRSIWKNRRLFSGIPLVTAFLLCIIFYYYANKYEEQQLQVRFNTEARQVVEGLRKIENDHAQQLVAVSGLFEASDQVTPLEFSQFSQKIMKKSAGFKALSWAPLINQNEAKAYSESMTQLLGYPISISRPEGLQANSNSWLVPVTFIEPLTGNEAVIGLDINSEPVRAAALRQAMETHQVAMTGRIFLSEDPEGPGGALMVIPVHDIFGKVNGFCTQWLDLRNIIQQFESIEGLVWTLRDISDNGLILDYNSNEPLPQMGATSTIESKGIYYQDVLNLADRQWHIVLFKKFEDIRSAQNWGTLAMLFLAFFGCSMIGGLALIFSSERDRISKEVTRKTRKLHSEVVKSKALQMDLAENVRRYRDLFDESPVGHALNRLSDGQFLAINQTFAKLTGYSIKELNKISYWDLTPESYAEDEAKQLELLNTVGRYGPYEKHYIRKDESLVDVRLNGTLVESADGEKLILSIVEDISDKARAEDRLKLMAKVFQHSGEAIVISDHNNSIVDVNEVFSQVTGYDANEVVGKNPSFLSSGRSTKEDYNLMWASINSRGFWQGEIWDRHKNGHTYPKWLVISVVRDKSGNLTHYIGSFSDITERKKAEEQIHFLAHHDPLTQLPNRFSLQARLDQAFAAARRDSSQVAVMFIDMDHFKNINDTLGHHIGDLLLVEVAQRLSGIVRESDIVARLGGDEFVVALIEITESSAPGVANKIVHELGKPYKLEEHLLHSTPSIGISLFPDDGETVDDVMRHADTAMYQAKSKGRNNYQYFTASMNTIVAERLTLEGGLRQALVNNEFLLHYQPQIDISTGKVIAIEALLRWDHPEQGMIPPMKFIPIAEETGMIEEIGKRVLNEAMRQLSEWRQIKGFEHLRIAINLSAHQLRDNSIISIVSDALDRYSLSKGAVELEITESVAMQAPERNIILLNDIRNLGVELAIDDFGTGYSSLSYLKLFPLDRLKLDRSFVMDIEHDSNDAAICAATISLAHSLGLSVVAEGVENEFQLKYLSDLGCDIVQGFYFCMALPPDECLQFIKENVKAQVV